MLFVPKRRQVLKGKSIAIILPAFNESGLITKTLNNVPDYVDLIIPVNDGSTDGTLKEMKKFAKKDPRVQVINKEVNGGIGSAVKMGIPVCIDRRIDYTVLAAGDNQCDLSKIQEFVTICEDENYDVCRGNRFLDKSTLNRMPSHRKFGNAVYSFVTKFVSGYYSLFDFQSAFSAIRTNKLEEIDLHDIRDDYLYDNSVWINLNIVNATIKEIAIPSIYAEEESNINYTRFVSRSFPYFIYAFINRIYQKYILIMHPIGLFFVSGSFLFLFGLLFGSRIALQSIGANTASTATVMLSVVPFIVGFELLLQAFVLDIQNEPKK